MKNSELIKLLPMPPIPPANTKRKLRWYQFSLRTLLIAVTLFAFACSWFAVKIQQAKRQKEIVNSILEAGGSVIYDYQYTASAVPYGDRTPPGPEWLRQILGDDFFADVARVSLGGEKTTNSIMKKVQKLMHLKSLMIGESKITDTGLESLKEMKDLKKLYIRNIPITDAGLKSLEGLTGLNVLFLSEVPITDAGLVHLKGLKQINTLILAKIDITDAGLTQFEGLDKIEKLTLHQTRVTEAGVTHFQEAVPKASISLIP